MKDVDRISRALLSFCCFAALVPLVLAYFMQLVLNVQPCVLCLYERVPFFIALFIVIVFTWLKKWPKLFINAYRMILLINVSLSLFHVGVEHKIFTNFLACSTRTGIFDFTPNDIEAVREQLIGNHAKLNIQACDEVNFQLLGLSLATWNCIYCLAIVLILTFVRSGSLINVKK